MGKSTYRSSDMTPQGRIDERTAKMREILGPPDNPRELSDANREELRHMETANAGDVEQVAMMERCYGPDSVSATVAAGGSDLDELRHAAKLTNYFEAARTGRSLSGPEAEFSAEMGCNAGEIPVNLLDAPRSEVRHTSSELRAASVAPSDAGTNLAAVQHLLYAPSIRDMFSIDTPIVRPGTHAEPVITAGASAGFTAGEGRDATAVVVEITATDPHMFSGRLSYSELQRLKVATDTWEPALRTNLSAAMSDGLNTVLLQKTAGSEDPKGLITSMTPPSDPGTTNVGFDDYIENLVADELDGIFSTMPSQLRLAVNSTVKTSMMTVFRDVAASDLGSISIWDYIADKVDMLVFNHRMPSKASNVSIGIAHRIGRTDVKLATMPMWGNLTISDIYF